MLLVVVDDVAGEYLERLASALIKELIAGLVEALGDVIGAGFLFVDNLGDHTGTACVDRSTDVAGSQVEELRGHLSDLAQLGNLRGFANKIAGLDSGAHCFRGLGQIVGGVRLVGQVHRLLTQQGRQLFVTVVVEDVTLPVGEGRCMGCRDAGDLEDRVALAGGRRLRGVTLLGLECLGEQELRCQEVRQWCPVRRREA